MQRKNLIWISLQYFFSTAQFFTYVYVTNYHLSELVYFLRHLLILLHPFSTATPFLNHTYTISTSLTVGALTTN